jgi:hypothetical protein
MYGLVIRILPDHQQSPAARPALPEILPPGTTANFNILVFIGRDAKLPQNCHKQDIAQNRISTANVRLSRHDASDAGTPQQ